MRPISRRPLLMAAIAVLLASAGTPGLAETASARTPMVATVNALGLATLAEQTSATPMLNHVVSPLGLGSSLALLAQGAQGGTAARLMKALDFPDAATIATAWAGTTAALSPTAGRTPSLALAAGLWHIPAQPVEGPARERLSGPLGATVEPLMGDGAALINGWAREKSAGMIPVILDWLDPATELVIAHALAFKAPWAVAFDPAATRPLVFDAADGSTPEPPMMTREDKAFLYRQTDSYRAVRLPYADPAFALVLVRPQSDGKLTDLLAPDAGGTLPEWLLAGSYATQPGRVTLPRLSLSADSDLLDRAANPTVAKLLDGPLDIGGLGPAWAGAGQRVGQAVQAVALRWDETGTEAAAVTAIATARRVDPGGSFSLTLDRPFAFALVHVPTGVILIAGAVAKPG